MLYNEEALETLDTLIEQSIITDPPYETTSCK